MISGAQAMVNCLEAQGVTVVFGYPGAAICPFYDCLAQSGIRHILVRSEQNAGHAASGYARVAGRPGVCIATSGPGATNLLTALATAYADSIPIVAITGQVETSLLGRDVFQEVDTTGAASPFIKYSYLVEDARDIPRVFREAFYIASTGRPGPVLIDIPVDIQRAQLDFVYPEMVSIRGYKPRIQGHSGQIERVSKALCAAKRPLLVVGGGAIGARGSVRALCESCGLPAVSTMMGIGTLPSKHPLYFGMLGQSGSDAANEAVGQSDLLMILGARAGNRAVGRPGCLGADKTVIHIDIDTAEIGKNVGTTIPLVGDAASVLAQLCERQPHGDWQAWRDWLCARRTAPPAASGAGCGFVDPEAFVRLLSQELDDDAVYVSDVGQNQIWSAKNYDARDGLFLTTGGMGTMGYALPAAIGARLAAPERQVAAVCGDGAFQMEMMELATANQHDVTVKLVVMNNQMLGMVREIQRDGYGGRETAVALGGGPEIEKLAEAYHLQYLCLDAMEHAHETVRAFLDAEGSCILECAVDPRAATH
ncbi:biosynthetic-type acetolactate synthase large subunit [Anaerotruncus sp.]|jgi:acetolactate synthase-1/2/3 large subunit|uniref:biosynthetic-type acetolactate synthase large subunit n=1 Tax=Anaerotruncus TaxID=244127 RepID=UPI00216C2F38|nr:MULTISPECIES: biosynthetic-type acetolactate synthase large subunit [Anaerotruncus]MCI8493749.1 biosynthetic-type acetolactate synthase large subunit [Anaerotruncus sp.]